MANQSSQMQQRLDFIGLDAKALKTLRGLGGFVSEAIGPALDVFYGKVRQTPEVKRFFKDDGHMSGAQSRQARHWGVISEGQFGDEYARGVRAIGETHARLGLEPRWYIGGYALVLEQLIHAAVRKQWPTLTRRTRPEEVSEALYRIDRMMFHLPGQASLRGIAGFRLGRVSDITPNEPEFGLTPEEIVRYWCLRSGIPYLGAADIGHDAANKIVPFGPR